MTQLLLKLAEEGSVEELQRIEALFRISREARESSAAVRQAKLESLNERIAANVTAMAEGLKLHFEAYKNLTVLDSGALVAFAVVTHYLVPSPVQQSVLGAAYSLVLLSLVASLVMTFVVGDQVLDVMQPHASPDRGRVWRVAIRVVAVVATGAFVVGLVLFLLFLNLNL